MRKGRQGLIDLHSLVFIKNINRKQKSVYMTHLRYSLIIFGNGYFLTFIKINTGIYIRQINNGMTANPSFYYTI